MKFNSVQKKILVLSSFLIVVLFILWLGYGAEIFTKTQIVVEKNDELFGTTYKVLEDKFILGLDYTMAIAALIVMPSLLLVFLKRTKKKIKTNE